jgi:hypothetical protein
MNDCARRRCAFPRSVPGFVLFLSALLSGIAAPVGAVESVRLIAADARGVTLEYRAPAPVFSEQSTPFGVFHAIRLDDHGIVGEEGRPGLPVRGAGIAIPEGTTPRLSYEILATRDYPGVRPLPIADGPLPEGVELLREGDQAFDPAAYDGVAVSAEPIRFEELGRLRHHRVGQVGIAPMTYDPAAGRVTLVERARIRIDFESSTLAPRGGAMATSPVGTEPAWEEAYRRTFLNYESARSFRVRPLPGLDRTDHAPPVRGVDASSRGAAVDPAGAPRAESDAASDLPDPARLAREGYAPRGAAGTGNREFRLFVQTTGLYYATFNDLAARGWPAGIPVNEVCVYEKALNAANPAEPLLRDVPISIEEAAGGTAGVFDGDDTIYFYLLGFHDRFRPAPAVGRFSNLNAYWMSWRAEGGARMAPTAGWYEAEAVTTPDSYVHRLHFEENFYFIPDRPESELSQNYPNIESYYWYEPIAYQESTLFNAYGRDPAKPVRVRSRWQGLYAGTHYITKWLRRGMQVTGDTLLFDRAQFGTGDSPVFDTGFTIPGARLNDGQNIFKFRGNGASGTPTSLGSGAYFDWFEIDYHRFYRAQGGTLRFTSGTATGDVELVVSDLAQNSFLLYDISDSLNPTIVTLDPSQIVQTSPPPQRRFQLRFRASVTTQKTWLLMQYDTVPSFTTAVPAARMPVDQGPTNFAEDTADDLTVDPGADVIVLAHPNFLPAFAAWKAAREAQGHVLRVVAIQDVYDQFNGGVKSPFAIRNFLRHAYRNWAEPPDYLVLLGDANEDHRNDVLGNPKFRSDTDWVPTMVVYGPVPNGAQRLERVGSDHWYIAALGTGQGDFDIFPEMYVGRLPVGSATEAQTLADKLTAYDTYVSGDAWRNRGFIVSDDQFSNPLSGSASYCYQSIENIFERGGDSLQAVYTKYSCFNGFSVEHFKLEPYLAALNRPEPPNCNGSCCANLIAAQMEARRGATPAWVTKSSEGHLFHMFSGHANRAVLTSERFVEYSGDFLSPDSRITEQLTNYGKPFIFLGLGCHVNEFENYNEGRTKHCISESMLFLPNRGAIASVGSTGFEWLPTNFEVQIFLGYAMFSQYPRDPDTGRPRAVLGETTYTGLIRLAIERGAGPLANNWYRDTIRTYGLLGDPTMRYDMAPPFMSVRVAGEDVAPGAAIRAGAGTSEVQIRARLADDVDNRQGGFTAFAGGNEVPGESFTVTPYEESPLGACHGVDVLWPATLEPADYTIRLVGTDWLGRTMEFPLKVELGAEFRLNGQVLAPNDVVPLDAELEVRVTSPVALSPGDVDFRVNGEAGYFTVSPGTDDREWLGVLNRALPADTARVETLVRGAVRDQFRVRVQAEAFEGVYFYPSPWDGDGPAFFTYQLSYPAGSTPRRARISVFTVSGRRVIDLVAPVGLGRNTLEWDVRDAEGDPIANGVYLFRVVVETSDGRALAKTDKLVVHR